MAKENLENISTERLIKRNKLAFAVLFILIVAIVLSVALLVYAIINGDGFQTYVFVSAGSCFLIGIIIYSGIKKTKEELARRSDN